MTLQMQPLFARTIVLIAACLSFAPGARAQVPDLAGDYALVVAAQTVTGESCVFEGTASLSQNGSALSGSADLTETTGTPTCPSMPSADATGDVQGSDVSLVWIGADGEGDSTGTLSYDDLVMAGPVDVSAGPYTSMSGNYTATRVIPEIAGSWQWTASLDPPGGQAGALCDYAGQGQFTRDVNQISGSATLNLVAGDAGSCPAMPTASASGTIDPQGNVDIQMTGADGVGSFSGSASPDGTTLSGTFSVSGGPYLGGVGTFTGQNGGALPTLTTLAIVGLVGMLLGATILTLRRTVRPA